MGRSAGFKALAAIALVALVLTANATAAPPKTGSLTLVGHNPLMSRGMNAAIAIHGDYAYIGSRTDFYEDDLDASGIMVVDISDPTDPEVVNVIGPPDTANPGESSRELRVWKSQDILIVLHTNCGGATAHGCTGPSQNSFKFFDISGDNAADPELILTLAQSTHEFFLWEDPSNPERALMFGGSAGNNMTIWDISPVLDGQPPTVLRSGGHGYTATGDKPAGGLHSLSVSNDGRFAYYALLTGGFAVVDVSDFTSGVANPQLRLVTQNELRPTWPGPGAHSAVKLWGRDWVWVSDEVYGTITAPGHGCPWGWARMIDISDPTAPTVEADYRIPENDPSTCDDWNPPRTSYSAHNPTLTPHVALSTWHSGGLQAVNIQQPHSPTQLAEFFPEPLPEVTMEDPRLSSDPDTGRHEKVVMWSYPIIRDGLIYVVDLRNGLYILKYRGAFEREIARIGFLEGNSNLGDALCFEPVGTAPGYCN
jgi:hypothetical protein